MRAISDAKPERPTVIPSGKYEGALIRDLSNEDLMAARTEFSRGNGPIQGAIMAQLSSRARAKKMAAQKKRGQERRHRAVAPAAAPVPAPALV